MNADLDKLHPYPFEKLRELFQGTQPPSELAHIALSIGEPKHESPAFVADALARHLSQLAVYPQTKGLPRLRDTIANWACQRFTLGSSGLCPDTQVLPVNGTREALFAFAQAVVNRADQPLVVCPNPFYQIYEGAAFLAGAEPWYLPCLAENQWIPDFDAVPEQVWQRCQLLYLCSPGNPTGAVISSAQLQRLIALADRYDFVIASDECYSEIYTQDQPPVGLLQACHDIGRNDYARCVVFHSLSKRSNLPGLRSGFVAGDAHLLKQFLLYRTYHGCAMSVPVQEASIIAWQDEAHVAENRRLYREKFARVLDILDGVLEVSQPDAGFYLWAGTPIDDTQFARGLFGQQHVTVLPGQYLSREVDNLNPGKQRIRMALVATVDECVSAARRIKEFVNTL